MAGIGWIGPLIQLVGGVVGEAASQGDRDAQLKVIQKAQEMFGGLSVPELQHMVAQTVPSSSLESYSPDAQYEGDQRDVLSRLDAIEKGGGFGAEDKADLSRIGQQISEQQRQATSSLSNALARRGATGSGEDYASRLALAQNSIQNSNQAGLDQSKLALQRRLSALSQRGQLATSLRGEDFSEASQKAAAQDAINQYNASARNNAAAANNANAAQTFNMNYEKARGAAGLSGDLSNVYGAQGKSQQQFWAGLGRAGGDAANAYQGVTKTPAAIPQGSLGAGDFSTLSDSDWQSLLKRMSQEADRRQKSYPDEPTDPVV